MMPPLSGTAKTVPGGGPQVGSAGEEVVVNVRVQPRRHAPALRARSVDVPIDVTERVDDRGLSALAVDDHVAAVAELALQPIARRARRRRRGRWSSRAPSRPRHASTRPRDSRCRTLAEVARRNSNGPSSACDHLACAADRPQLASRAEPHLDGHRHLVLDAQRAEQRRVRLDPELRLDDRARWRRSAESATWRRAASGGPGRVRRRKVSVPDHGGAPALVVHRRRAEGDPRVPIRVEHRGAHGALDLRALRVVEADRAAARIANHQRCRVHASRSPANAADPQRPR